MITLSCVEINMANLKKLKRTELKELLHGEYCSDEFADLIRHDLDRREPKKKVPTLFGTMYKLNRKERNGG